VKFSLISCVPVAGQIAVGVTAFDTAERGPVPAEFAAVTVNR
jgi:hypothetical protein